MPRFLERLLLAYGRLNRRLAAWAQRAERRLLLAENPGLDLATGARLEPGWVFRLGARSHVVVGDGARLRMNGELKADPGARVRIGERVHVGPWCTFSALESIEIGDDCLIAERVSIRDHDHATGDPTRPYHAQGYVTGPVTLGKNVWVGGGVTIVKGVSLGDNCVVGANAVVTRSFPANSVIAGVPARLIRELAPENLSA